MCTAINMLSSDLFGRTLDLEQSLGEEIIITPSGFDFNGFKTKYSIIGVAAERCGMPLYFDGMNERGLCAAALSYPQFAFYNEEKKGALNIPSYSLLPYILGSCENVEDAQKLLFQVNVTNASFSKELPPSPLHWMISDKSSSICAEPDRDGLSLHPDRFNVLTNSPGFDHHALRVCDCMSLTPAPPKNRRLHTIPAEWALWGFPVTFPQALGLSAPFFLLITRISPKNPWGISFILWTRWRSRTVSSLQKTARASVPFTPPAPTEKI